ncbi:MAG: DUF262 domain-containing protein [Gammaproteobacteria bacterium]|nr:DUF262 domain-containing protein [Gammaproteobacteria bacterium]
MTDAAMTNTSPVSAVNPDSAAVHTSLAQLFSSAKIQAIEIPLIQRDYAQGRRSMQVDAIREQFLDSLCSALRKPDGIDLDFVFGDVVDGTLYPLDGQQRLTTLFLLHCYLAWHLPETIGIYQPWHAFHYATRPGARAFCRFLSQCRPDMAQGKLSHWLQDQATYLPTWEHDPTIQGMLVVLDDLHLRYRETPPEDLRSAWLRLIDPQQPAIRFYLLPIRANHLDNSLYVKMNSRGKPLTAFENFKAELEGLLRDSSHIPCDKVDNFSRKIDTEWVDLFWHYRGNNDLIDEEVTRYLRFLFEVLAWNHDVKVNHLSSNDAQELARLANELLGPGSKSGSECLDWITQALDVWLDAEVDGVRKPRPIKQLFEQLFTRSSNADTLPLRVFNFRDFDESQIGVDMFRACCELYGTRAWRLAHTLLFYGVLRGLIVSIPQEDFHLRLRQLRNLIEASQDEIRAGERNNMPTLLSEVEKIMAGGPLSEILTFNQVQVANEQEKQSFLAAYPTSQDNLHRLEDHALLRGGLTVFDLDPTTFTHRAQQFSILLAESYDQVTGALIAKGNDGRSAQRTSTYRLTYLGAPRQSEPWEDLFRARKGEKPHPTKEPLMGLLDVMAAGQSPKSIMDAFLNHPDTRKDWRYYIVKYEVMRRGESGCHVISPTAGYSDPTHQQRTRR